MKVSEAAGSSRTCAGSRSTPFSVVVLGLENNAEIAGQAALATRWRSRLFTLLSCLVGEMLVSLQLATTPWFDLYGVLMRVDLLALSYALISHVTPVMMLVYGVSSYIAYSLSIFTRK